MNCPNCLEAALPGTRFCARCGHQIDSGPAPARASAAGAAMPPGGAAAASAPWGMNTATSGLIDRIKNIVLTPKTEWPIIAPEPTSIGQVYTGYVMPLSALAAAMSFLRMSVIGVSLPFGGAIRTPILAGLTLAIVTFAFSLLGLFLVALIINGLAPTFSGVRDQRQALKVAAYSFTPAYLGSVLALSPVLPTLLQLLAGLYGIYVLSLGLPVVMRAPREKAFGYTAAVVICTFLLGILFMLLSAAGHFARLPGLAGYGYDPAAQEVAQQQGAAAVGNVIGGMLGTDDQGKAQLGAALSNLAKAGQQMEQQQQRVAQQQTEQQRASDAVSPPAEPRSANSDVSAAAAAGAPPSPLAAVGGLVSAMGGALGGSHRVQPVDFHSLRALLPPALPGMKRTDATGQSQGALGVKTSSAKGDYVGDAGTVHIEITDLSGVSGLLDVANGLVQDSASESDTGYERPVTVGGRAMHEKYDTRARSGELSVMIAKRFQVAVSGDGVDMQTLVEIMGGLDLAQLESMQNAGAQ